MKNKMVRISFCFLIFMTIILSSCPIAFASTAYIQVPYNQPELNGDDFYIEILLYNSSTKQYKSKVIYGVTSLNYFIGNSAFDTGSLKLKLDLKPTQTDFYIVDNGSEKFYVCLAEFLDDGSVTYYSKEVIQEGTYKFETLLHTDYGSGYSAVSYRVFGDVVQVDENYTKSVSDFTIVYGQTNSVNQSILQLINAVSVVAGIDQNIANKLDSIISGINAVNGDVTNIYNQLLDLFEIVDDIYDKISSYQKYIDEIEEYLGSIDNFMRDIFLMISYIYDDTQDMVSLLRSCENKLQQIIDLLNAGQNEPTLKNPANSVGEAFGEIGNMFDGLGDFGGQLDSNKQQNQANMDNAKALISGFFGILPTPLIVALAFCAICILIAKVIGR